MASIDTMLGLIGKLESPYITVHQERCALVRNRHADCLRCAESCASGCISYDGEALSVSPEKCIGCGTCATVCPTCALEAHHPGDAALVAAAHTSRTANAGAALIGCGALLERARGRYDEERVVRVECLGRVDESLLAELAAEGADEVVLIHGDCPRCEHRRGRDAAEAVVDTAAKLLDIWGSPMTVRFSGKLPAFARKAADHDAGRRAVLTEGVSFAARAGAIVAERAVEDALGVGAEDAAREEPPRCVKVMGDGTLPHFLPDRRERLLDALAALGEPADVMVDTRLWGHVVIDTDRCASCQMCAVFCPTAALTKFADGDGTFGVEHRPSDCVKCRSCEAICPADAIEISEEVFAVDLMGGVTDRYAMRPRAVQHDTPHTIWHTARTMMKTDQVYER
ncbi:4Fe-4S dicluster domain-containing protein [Adlercreutzia caecimuris]|uniref:4Fe-4S dicluster domain-containing protein n=1 Tax=Adlercreutzia caecimuris TaxID=671266 RepID=UPI001C3EB8A6|nr:4Fe-4S binding protein [Adlercreutzia caecimuris]MCR2037030.1 4Fe-4S binding protein [Adlercreutzia caecimuris]